MTQELFNEPVSAYDKHYNHTEIINLAGTNEKEE